MAVKKLSEEQMREIQRLYDSGISLREGASRVGVPLGTFAGTIAKLRKKGVVLNRYNETGHRRQEYRAPSLPRLKFMDESDA